MKTINDNKGFTLVELFVALLIFSVGIVGVVKLQLAAVASNSFSLQLTQALNIAGDRIERLKNEPLTSVDFSTEASDNPHSPGNVTTREGRSFTPTWTVTAIAGSTSRNVTVNVTWTDKGMSHATALNFIKGSN